MTYNEKLIEGKLIALHTGFVGKVLSVADSYAAVKPLTYSKSAAGILTEQAQVTAYVPAHVKREVRMITYLTSVAGTASSVTSESESADVLVDAELTAGDIVYCGVCERDFTAEQLNGDITEPTRHHDANDAIILAVL